MVGRMGALALGAATIASLAQGAAAQTATDVVVMRRQVSPPRPRPTPVPSTSPAAETGRWSPGAPVSDAPACSATAPATRTVGCVGTTSGASLPDSSCAADGVKPSTSTTTADYRTCTYRLIYGDWSEWTNTCGTGTHTRTNDCQRVYDNKSVDVPVYCGKPTVESETLGVYTSCTGTWSTTYGTCTTANRTTATVQCVRDGSTVAESNCATPSKPASGDQACRGTWSQTAGSCTGGSTTTVVACRAADGSALAASECNPSTKPAATTTSCGDVYADGFEAGGWSVNYGNASFITSNLARSGTKVALLATGSPDGNRSDISSKQLTGLVVGKQYRVRVHARGVNQGSGFQIYSYDGSSYVTTSTFTIGTAWTAYDATFTAKTTTVILRLLLQSTGHADAILDDVTVATMN